MIPIRPRKTSSRTKSRSSKKRRSSSKRRIHRIETLETRRVLASLSGQVFNDANENGVLDAGEQGFENALVYVDANDDGSFNAGETSALTDAAGQYSFANVAAGDHAVRIQTGFGISQTNPRGFFATGDPPGATGGGQGVTSLFSLDESGQVADIGPVASVAFNDLVRTNSGSFFALTADADGIYEISFATSENLLFTAAQDLFDGLAYDPATDTIYAIGRDTTASNVTRLYTINVNDATPSAVAVGTGLNQLLNVSDLTFDTVNNRIVGFDNSTDTFFEFQTDGTGSLLQAASQSLNTRSLAFDGSRFIAFNDDDAAGTEIFEVDPDTGSVTPSFTASESRVVQGLTFSFQGDVARRVTVAAADVVVDLDFGVFGEVFQGSGDSLFLNEILVLPEGGDVLEDQYIELRGEDDAVIADGTYLVVVNESDTSPGQVQNVIDLGGASFGSNGFLVLLQAGSTHIADTGANVLRSATDGFESLAGGRFSTLAGEPNSLNVNGGTFILLESGTAPVPGDDIDVDDNGTADLNSVFGQWDVIESISLRPSSNGFSNAYGDLVFVTADSAAFPVNTQPGAEVVQAAGFGYAGRIGDSLGDTASDWVVGAVINEAIVGPPVFGLSQNDSTGSATPAAFNGRNLDHVGKSNFVGAVRGLVVHDQIDPDVEGFDNPAENVVVLADTNSNGRIDELTFTLDPDDFVDGAVLTNSLSGVTFTAGSANGVHAGEVTAFDVGFGNRVFAGSNGVAFGAGTEFRADFYRPASSATIEAVSAGPSTFIRLDAFDADNNLIDSVVSRELLGNASQLITVTGNGETIDHVIAFSEPVTDPGGGTSSLEGRIGEFSYTQNEASTVTDANGLYEIPILFAGAYDVTYINDPNNEPLFGAEPVSIVITMFENLWLGPNATPTIDDLDITLEESPPVRSNPIGTLNGQDPDADGSVAYQIVSGREFGIVVDPFTGDLSVADNTNLDFETNPVFQIEVAAIDNLGASSVAVVTVTLTDRNEAPVVLPSTMSVDEDANNGLAIGQIQATDQDAGQTLSFRLVDQSAPGAFRIDGATGVVSVNNTALIDFETNRVMSVRVQVSDDQGLSTEHLQLINVINQNDRPVITTVGFTIPENSAGLVGAIQVDDPDAGQTFEFQLTGGSEGALGLFGVTAGGDVVILDGAVIDFDQQPRHELNISVSDRGAPEPALTDSRQIVVTVTDVNELPSLAQSSATIGENAQAGDEVDFFGINDPEMRETDHTIELLNGLDSADFVFERILGPPSATNQSPFRLSIAAGVDLDFESDPTKELLFRVTDNTVTNPGLQNSVDLPFTVNITDENDAPFLVTSSITVSEDAVLGSEVGRIVVGDFDAVDSFTVALVGGTGASSFDISSDGIVTVATTDLDADVLSEPLTLEIEFTDGGGATSTGTVLARINNVNEAPVFTPSEVAALPTEIVSSEPFTFVIPENLAVDPEGEVVQWAVFDPNLVGVTGEPDALPPWLEFDPETRVLRAFPAPTDIGSVDLVIRAFELGFTDLGEPGPPSILTDLPLRVTITQGSNPLSNGRDRRDVDNDRVITAIDALRIINFINRFGAGSDATLARALSEELVDINNPLGGTITRFAGFVDVNSDGFVSAIDAVIVINGIGDILDLEGESTGFLSDSINDREEAIDSALADFGTPTLF